MNDTITIVEKIGPSGQYQFYSASFLMPNEAVEQYLKNHNLEGTIVDEGNEAFAECDEHGICATLVPIKN